MEYKTMEGLTLDLSTLTEEEMKFYNRALIEFRANPHWVSFDDFAFGMRSPIYRRSAPRDPAYNILESPLFLALVDMSLRLGIQQGLVAAS